MLEIKKYFKIEKRSGIVPENCALWGLKERVIHQDLCTLCGACLSLCPHLRFFEGRIVNVSACDLSQGRCFDYCPRTGVDLDGVSQTVFNHGHQDPEMGPFKRVFMARSTDSGLRDKAQTGGVVSTLMAYAFKKDIIHAAVLTLRDTSHFPKGHIMHTPEEIMACAGSGYVAGPTLEAFNRGNWQAIDRIGIVGTPCQILALAQMRASNLERRPPVEQIKLTIGLFCTWAFTHKPFLEFLTKHVNAHKIDKLDITPPPERLLKVTANSKTHDVPLDEVRSFIRPACRTCLDMTSELSDVSVGTVEGREGWNTVIVRSDHGEEVVHLAEAAGVLETQPLPEENLAHLQEASLLKKQHALRVIQEQGGLEKSYLRPSSGCIQNVFRDIM
jgi:coenzyme F420 hydrogenase subunit beta